MDHAPLFFDGHLRTPGRLEYDARVATVLSGSRSSSRTSGGSMPDGPAPRPFLGVAVRHWITVALMFGVVGVAIAMWFIDAALRVWSDEPADPSSSWVEVTAVVVGVALIAVRQRFIAYTFAASCLLYLVTPATVGSLLITGFLAMMLHQHHRRLAFWTMGMSAIILPIVASLAIQGTVTESALVIGFAVFIAYSGFIGAGTLTGIQQRRAAEVQNQLSTVLDWQSAVRHDAERAERLRLAHLLHDGVSRRLSLVSFASLALGGDRELHGHERETLIRMLGAEARELANDFAHTLRSLVEPPEGESIADLESALTHLETAADALGLRLRLRHELDELEQLISPLKRSAVLALLGEAVVNAVKYAGPGELFATIARDGNDLVVTTWNRVPTLAPEMPSSNYGVASLQARFAALGGELLVERDAETFRLIARLPLADGAA